MIFTVNLDHREKKDTCSVSISLVSPEPFNSRAQTFPARHPHGFQVLHPSNSAGKVPPHRLAPCNQVAF